MNNIFNLIIYIGIIYLLVQLCNIMMKSSEIKNAKNDENFSEQHLINDINPAIYFDYEPVPIEQKKEHI
jgi:large-conductance mechanosensitive channel